MEKIENNKTILEEIFNSFTTENDLNFIFNKPFEKNGKVYATNRHCLIRVDTSVCDF